MITLSQGRRIAGSQDCRISGLHEELFKVLVTRINEMILEGFFNERLLFIERHSDRIFDFNSFKGT